MRQTSTIKRTTVSPITSKNRLDISLPQTSSKNGDLNQKIAEKAYELYQKRNGAPGSAEEDWAQAEKIIKGK